MKSRQSVIRSIQFCFQLPAIAWFCLALLAGPQVLAQDLLNGPTKGDPHPAAAASPTPLPIVLPTPVPPPLGERKGPTYEINSTQGKILTTRSPAGAPNVVIILLDDVGFAATETFGGPIHTPTLSALAGKGLRYNAFHTTALCSPTRAALLTGRNHHAVNTAAITESATGYDGYTTVIPQSAATIAEVLRQFGYSTAAFGKWHNTPPWETGESGPYDHWAVGLGFEKFYGFNGGDTHQFEPELYEGTTPIRTPAKVHPTRHNENGIYNLNDDLADQAIEWLQMHNSVAPAKPFFMYWAPGGVHAPHQVLPGWSDGYEKKVGGRTDFQEGWDALSANTFEKQKAVGVIPEGALKTPRPPQIPAWQNCSATVTTNCCPESAPDDAPCLNDQQRLVGARLAQLYAGFLEQTDFEVGRIVDTLKNLHDPAGHAVFNNTLFLYIVGDNGASAEGTLVGAFNELPGLAGVGENPALLQTDENIKKLGTRYAYNHYPVGFAWAFDTPFQWTKQVASFFGGTRNALVVTWPKKIQPPSSTDNGLRSQFHHVIDIAPTIYEAVGIPADIVSVNGAAQQPLDGKSMLYTFAPNAGSLPSNHHVQYFEMLSNRAIYSNGWIASAFHKIPWKMNSDPPNLPILQDDWELYDLRNDFTQATNIASQHPDKLAEMIGLFNAEAGKNNVFPLDDRGFTRICAPRRPNSANPNSDENRREFLYHAGAKRIPEATGPNTHGRSYTIEAQVRTPSLGAKGVIVAVGGVMGGWSLYVNNQWELAHSYNYFSDPITTIRSHRNALSPRPEPHTIKYHFEANFADPCRQDGYPGGGNPPPAVKGTGWLYVDNELVNSGLIPCTENGTFSGDESLDIGTDTGSPVVDYGMEDRAFTGTIDYVKITLEDGPTPPPQPDCVEETQHAKEQSK